MPKKKTSKKTSKKSSRKGVVIPKVRTGGKSEAATSGKKSGWKKPKSLPQFDLMSPELTEEEDRIITASEIQLPSPHLSSTQIEMYLRCPQQYYRRYVRGIKSPPGVALVEGEAHHHALHLNNQHKIAHGEDMPFDDVFESFADRFSDRKREVEDWEDQNPDAVISRGEMMLLEYHRKFAPRYVPNEAESEVRDRIGPVNLLGYIDTEGTMGDGKKEMDCLIDYKTGARSKSDSQLQGSIQLSLYTYFRRDQPSGNVGFVMLLKSGKVVPQFTSTDPARIRWVRKLTLHVANAISLGSFPPTDPTNWACNPRFCGYHGECRGAC